MLALVKTHPGPDALEIMEVPVPSPGRGEVLIGIKAIAVCGTDLDILKDKYTVPSPLIIGHEFAGVIAELGNDVEGWRVGERVVAENTYGACGICELCRTGSAHICPEKKAYGSASPGVMAEFVVLPAASLHQIPEAVTDEQAALCEPLAVVNRGVLERAAVRPDDTVVVLGAGAIGLFAVQVCLASGAGKVILAGTDSDVEVRLPLGRRLGADMVVNVDRENLRQVIEETTSGLGADVVIEAAGSAAAVQEAIVLAGRGKIICAIGLIGDPVTLDWDAAVFKEIDIRFSKSSTYRSWKIGLKLMASGKVKADPLITHRYPLTEWREAMEAMESGRAVKSILIP